MDELTEADVGAALQQLDPLWEELFPAEQARIVQLLVARVDVAPAGEIEAAVIDQLRAVFRQPAIVVGTWRQAREEMDELTKADEGAARQQLDPLCDKLFLTAQPRLDQLPVARLAVPPAREAEAAAFKTRGAGSLQHSDGRQ